MKEITNILTALGYSEKEIVVYLTVLKHRKISPAEVAKITKISRTNVYNLAKELIAQGLITQDIADKSLNLVALPPENLRIKLEQLKLDIQKKEEQTNLAIEQLNNLESTKSYPVPKLRFFEEQELRDCLFQNASKWNESAVAKDGIWYGFQDHSFVENYFEWIDWSVKKFKNTNYQVKLFSNDSDIEEEMQNKIKERVIKFFGDTNFTSTLWVVGEYIIMISTSKHPFYLVELHDALMADNLREVFKKMWTNN